jgi:Flp pilus assembly protein TadD
LQLDGADAKSAIQSLQEAAELSPGSELIHQALAAAYRQDSRPEDADREMKQAEAIHNSHGSTTESSH